MTWGQVAIWKPLRSFGAATASFNLVRTTAAGPGVTAERFLDAVRTLVERHTTLRTRFVDGRQEIAGAGEMSVGFWELPESADLSGSQSGADVLAADSFDLTSEWPVRFAALLGADGGVVAAAFAISHVAADGWAADRLLADLAALLGAGPDLPETPWTPADQLSYERSDAGRRVGAASIDHWAGLLRDAPASMFDFTPLPVDGPPVGRYRLDSSALAVAASMLGARSGTSTATVVLTLSALWLANHCGHDSAVVELVAGNRVTPRLRTLRAPTAQDGLLALQAGDTDLASALRAAHHSAIKGYRRAMYDPEELAARRAEIGADRGLWFDLAVNFNHVRLGTDQVPRAADATQAELAEMSARSTVTRLGPLDWHDKKFMLSFHQSTPEHCSLVLIADARYLPPAVIERFLLGVERVVIAALNEELSTADVTRLIGVPPVERGAEWVRTRAGWVRPDAVRRLVERAAPGARVLVRPGPGGVAELWAETASDVDVAAVHREVVAAVTGETGVAAPDSYMLVARTGEPAGVRG